MQGFLGNLKDHRVTDAIGDLPGRRHGRGQGRADVGGQARDQRQRVRCDTGQARKNAVHPGPARAQAQVHHAIHHRRRVHPETLRLAGRHRANASAEDVAAGLTVPGQLQQLALGEVGVEAHAALLVQHAAEVAQHALGRLADAAFVLMGVEVQYREIALHGSPFVR
ncbi:hypothetical protein D9M71_110520 [compost metagenome]